MPLPLPNLDTRRWNDLLDEGRALIPRYAPAWTDHNVHDPGITLMELLAWLVEQDVYRVNRVPERHRRKFLALAGFAPRPPQPAQVALTFALAGSTTLQSVPAGVTLATGGGATPLLRFRTTAPLTVTAVALAALQVFDGTDYSDQTRLWRDRLPFPLLGENPASAATADADQQPAFYLGFDAKLPKDETVTLWFWFADGRSDAAERARILAEAEEAAAACQPLRPQKSCGPEPDDKNAIAPQVDVAHHSVRLAWEYWDGGAWRDLGDSVSDDTRGLTLDGAARVTLPADMVDRAVGAVGEKYFYLRARLAAGRPDAAPQLAHLALNTVTAVQATAARHTFTIAPGVVPPPEEAPQPGKQQPIRFALADDGAVTSLHAGSAADGPDVFVIGYKAATADTPGTITLTLVPLGSGAGLPQQQVTLPDAPVAFGEARVWTLTPSGFAAWQQRPDLDASQRSDAHFTLDATAGTITFGDGERGRVAPAGATILAAYDFTAGAAGNVTAPAAWRLAGADDAINRALLAEDPAVFAARLGAITNPLPASGGADAETVTHAAGRAAEALWAHERLLELCQAQKCDTLDQLNRADVLARAAPARAVTLRDFERLTLDVPGVAIGRARAWADLDPHYPCLQAPGTVTVLVLPGLPLGRPQPTPGLLESVRRYLNRRRTVGTRLVVVGPSYLTVRVQTAVRARPGADPVRVQSQIVAALDRFLDPLLGGPNGRGWPFGRDVYRSEILQVIDNVSGVDHVLRLELLGGEDEAQCGNLCVGPTWLVTPGVHEVEVEASE